MAEEFGAVEMCHLLEFDEIGNEQRRVDLREPNKLWQHPWMLVHRVKLHDRLKLVATGEKGEGPPVKLNLSSRVASIDPENCKVVLEKGDEIQADVIIGADGIYVCPSLNLLF
jgi:2-polyprenyl-6-methoxyphenol hydroxylase-like FAD-dependent oxidoreductase